MGSQATSPGQIITLPKGGGAQQGLGEKFSPDLHTGTGNFTVPIALPPGRNSFQPEIHLGYSTGTGNGYFGLGWSLGIPGVTRKTSKGIPRYHDYGPDPTAWDTFILSGAEDLVPVRDPSLDPSTATRYRPRTEGLFAWIVHHHDARAGTNYWEVRSKNGLVNYYGVASTAPPPYHPDFRRPSTAATIAKPKLDAADADRIFAWKLTLTTDPFGNRIEYLYEDPDRSGARDEAQGHRWDQPLLTQIRYADYRVGGETKFLVTVSFDYEDRDDPFSDYRAGFEIRTTKRCRSIRIETHADRTYKVRRYELRYDNQARNGVSLLTAVEVVGFDDAGIEGRDLPSLELGYSRFDPKDPKRRDFYPVKGPDLPATSLANTSMELVDLFGRGLPDILEMNGAVRYWRNRGNGEFDVPHPMAEVPAGLSLGDPGVQLIDADGDGRTDLLVTQGALAGYYPLRFGATWDRASFRKYRVAPSFDLKDPEIRLIDLTGDGVTDVIRSGARLECYFNDPREGWHETRWVERSALPDFPGISFSDPRVKWADLSGDGLQDLVLVSDRNVEYCPNLGYGSWGRRLHMENGPQLPVGYDPRRILLGDVDGDGLADLLYVDDGRVTLWINRSGNGWSDPIEVPGTPPVTDVDSIRLVDLLGSGISGVLWTRDAASARRDHYVFLDLTGGAKPYMLTEWTNNMGAITRVTYEPSTTFYLSDQARPGTRWRAPLPFPVQVVARIEAVDDLSRSRLTTEYRYHHGYWDGVEREFRGFGMVEQLDREMFARPAPPARPGIAAAVLDAGAPGAFSPPTLTRTWFHQGPIGDAYGPFREQDWSSEHWDGDPQLLGHTQAIDRALRRLDAAHAARATDARRRIRRDALRALRASVLRTELYALDGSPCEARPYTVTEQAYGVTEIEGASADGLPRIFFPHGTAQRTTQWERGDDPMTRFTFNGRYDPFGQALSLTVVAAPRRSRRRLRLSATEVADDTRVLATHTRTGYAEPPPGVYLHDRTGYGATLTLAVPPEPVESVPDDLGVVMREQVAAAGAIHDRWEADLAEWQPEDPLPGRYRVVGHSANRYDGAAFQGLGVGRVGTHGALTLCETLSFTSETISAAFGSVPLVEVSGRLTLPVGAPAGLDTNLGYRRVASEPGYVDGFYLRAQQRKYDVQDPLAGTEIGLAIAERDAIDHETTIAYDLCGVLPETVRDAVGLETRASYNYRVMQLETLTDPNENVTTFAFSPIGLLTEVWVRGKADESEGDRTHASTQLEYDFFAYRRSMMTDPGRPAPIGVRTIRYLRHESDPADMGETTENREYSDGFGRLLQTRTQGDEVRFGDPLLGGGEAVLPARQSGGRGGPLAGRRASAALPNVRVSGWQRYDNKGRVVEKYEPFFDVGWEYDPPADDQLGQKVTMFFDPRGQAIRTVSPDGSEQRIIYGIPLSLTDPPSHPGEVRKFAPTVWEAYTYDPDDNAGRTHPGQGRAYRHCFDTPTSILVDPMGRTILSVARKRNPAASLGTAQPPLEEYHTRSTYDIQGNLLTITDPLGRVAFRAVYDLVKRVWRTDSIDAGTKRMALDARNSEVQRRDGKGAVALREYDALKRATRLWARDAAGERITLREQASYGDEGDRTIARQTNALGRLVGYADGAGSVTTPRYDFKGNPLSKTRQVIGDAALASGWAIDWSDPGATTRLDPTEYVTSTRYDALNRPTAMLYPADVDGHRARLTMAYSQGGWLEQVMLDGVVHVERIAYDAKGQRAFIAYGNGILARYAYDPRTFRLVRVRAEHFTRAGTTYRPTGPLLQDSAYDYDASGNILAIHERVPGCGLPTAPDQLDRVFGYDSLYRLVTATGRECGQATPDPYWVEPVRCQDVTSTRAYSETYTYDAAGNLTRLAHTAANNGSFTRLLASARPSNRLDQVTVGTSVYVYQYDGSGNMTGETSSRRFEWDHADRLRAFRETAGAAPSVEARYLYDAGGVRVKKWVRRNGNGGHQESTVYVDGQFEHHQWTANGGGQNNHLHLMDNRRRVAIVRVGSPHPDDGGPAVQYHLGDHLGSSVVVLDGAGRLTNREEFLPYGETSFGSFGRKRYRFTGRERDEESGLSYHEARYYMPWLGRWGSSDPAGVVDGLNLFVYARGNPMLLIDPTGRQGNKADGGVSSAEGTEKAEKTKEEILATGYIEEQADEYLNAQASCRAVADYCKETFPDDKMLDKSVQEAKAKYESEASKQAQDNLNHYLEGTGKEWTMPSDVFQKHAGVQKELQGTFRDKFIDGVKGRMEGRIKDPQVDPKKDVNRFQMKYTGQVNPGTKDKKDPMYLSVGTVQLRATVTVSVVKRSDDQYQVQFEKWENQVFDVYNWDPGKATQVEDAAKKMRDLPTDSDMCCLENAGRGKAFLVRTDRWTSTDQAVVGGKTLRLDEPIPESLRQQKK
jgi:RHS repeat-associated protein